jgi:hypothetical protein
VIVVDQKVFTTAGNCVTIKYIKQKGVVSENTEE